MTPLKYEELQFFKARGMNACLLHLIDGELHRSGYVTFRSPANSLGPYSIEGEAAAISFSLYGPHGLLTPFTVDLSPCNISKYLMCDA